MARVATDDVTVNIRLEVVGTEHPQVRADIPLDQLTDELRNDPSYLWVEDWPTPGSDLADVERSRRVWLRLL